MSRTYERETKHYDFSLLTHLVETGQATFFEGPSIYVIKTEDGTVAVRPHQVIFTATPAPFEIVVADETVSEDPTPVGDQETATRNRGWVSKVEEEELLNYFGI